MRRQLADKAIDKENLEQQVAELQAIIAKTSTELAVAKRKAQEQHSLRRQFEEDLESTRDRASRLSGLMLKLYAAIHELGKSTPWGQLPMYPYKIFAEEMKNAMDQYLSELPNA